MLSVHLKQLRFKGFHGIHPEEKVAGAEFEINIDIHTSVKDVHHLSETVDYVTVYELVKKRMATPTPLLETLAKEMAESILAQFSIVDSVDIQIDKINPPIAFFQGRVGISYQSKRP
jgi:dihydroneopterin aldolase